MRLVPKNYSTFLKNRIDDGVPKLLFYHGYIAITHYNMGDCWGFEKALSVWDDITHKYKLRGAYYVKELKELRVARGIDTFLLQRFFPDHKPELVNEPIPYETVDMNLYAPPRDDLQKVALSFMASNGPYTENAKSTQQLIACDTGDGKTYCGVATCCYMSAPVLVIVPFSKLIDQWKDSFLTFTDIKPKEIMVIQGSKSCLKILDGQTKGTSVYIAMITTLNSFHSTYGDMKTIDLMRAMGCKVKIVDEVHRNMKAMVMIDALSNFQQNYYMSASPGRTDRDENRIFDTMFRRVPRFGQDFKKQDEKHLNIFIKKYSFLPDAKQLRSMCIGQKKWLNTKLYEKALFTAPSDQRASFEEALEYVVKSIVQRKHKDTRVLVLCETVDGTEYTEKVMNYFFPEHIISRYHGSLNSAEKKLALGADIICATTSSLGTGADIKDVQFVLNCGTYSSVISAIQVPGRARKLKDHEVAYIEMVNFGFQKTMAQFTERRSTLESKCRSGSITIVD